MKGTCKNAELGANVHTDIVADVDADIDAKQYDAVNRLLIGMRPSMPTLMDKGNMFHCQAFLAWRAYASIRASNLARGITSTFRTQDGFTLVISVNGQTQDTEMEHFHTEHIESSISMCSV